MVGTLILTLSIVTIEVVLIGAMALADTIEIACADFIRGWRRSSVAKIPKAVRLAAVDRCF